jgi:hypothetical protein
LEQFLVQERVGWIASLLLKLVRCPLSLTEVIESVFMPETLADPWTSHRTHNTDQSEVDNVFICQRPAKSPGPHPDGRALAHSGRLPEQTMKSKALMFMDWGCMSQGTTSGQKVLS